jgi:deoxyribonuclease V
MRINKLHAWKVGPAEGRALQQRLAARVERRPLPAQIKLVAGADMSFDRDSERFFGAVVVLSFPELAVVEEATAHHRPTFPYVPGLLSFREGPVLLKVLAKLRTSPDVFLFDGQGIAHPRRLGLASHLGLWLGRPSVGCAKSVLIGKFDEPGPLRGEASPLLDRDEVVGTALRTRDRTRPVYVSPGHLADLESSARFVLECSRGYRIPEPTRRADILAAAAKREYLAGKKPRA